MLNFGRSQGTTSETVREPMNPALNPSLLPLRDIHLPGAVLWWPPAFGWWILAGLSIILILVIWVRCSRGRRHRAALKALNAVTEQLRNGTDPVACLQQVSQVLRRFIMTVTPDSRSVAGVIGDEWLEFLDGRWDRDAFTEGKGRQLLKVPYACSPVGREEALELSQLCIAWIKSQPRGT